MGCSSSKGDAKAEPAAKGEAGKPQPEPAKDAEDGKDDDAGDADAFPTAPEDEDGEDQGGDFPSTVPTVSKVKDHQGPRTAKDKDTEANTINLVASNLSSTSISLGVSAAAASKAE